MKKFEKRKNNPPDKFEPDFFFTIGIQYLGKASRVFAKRLTAIVVTKFNVDLMFITHVLKLDCIFNLIVLLRFLYCLM